MTQRAGKEQYFQFNGLALTTNLAAEIRMALASGEIDASTIGPSQWKTYAQAMADGTFTFSGVSDDGTATTSLNNVMHSNLNGGGTKLWEYCPGGSAASRPLLKGNGFITAFESGGDVNGMVGFSGGMRVSGSVQLTTVAS